MLSLALSVDCVYNVFITVWYSKNKRHNFGFYFISFLLCSLFHPLSTFLDVDLQNPELNKFDKKFNIDGSFGIAIEHIKLRLTDLSAEYRTECQQLADR